MEVAIHEVLTPTRRLLPLESESGVGYMSIPYVKFFTSDWIAGCSAMDPFEELVYLKICLHNWDSGLPITEAGLSRLMRGHEEGITGALAYLLESGKITELEDGYASERAVESFNDANKRRDDAINAAAKRWKTKGKKDNAPAKPPHNDSICQPEPEPELEPVKKDIYIQPQTELIPVEPAKPKKRRRKPQLPLPGDFEMPESWIAPAIKDGVPDQLIAKQFEKFKKHHLSKGNVMADWKQAWGTWTGNYTDFKPRGNNNGSGSFNHQPNNGNRPLSSKDISLNALAGAGSGGFGDEPSGRIDEPAAILRPRFGDGQNS